MAHLVLPILVEDTALLYQDPLIFVNPIHKAHFYILSRVSE